MGKVVTSKGLNEFVQNGTVTHVPDHKATPKAETVPEIPKPEPTPKPDEKPAEPAPTPPKDDDEAVPVLSEDSRKYVNKQHRLRKEAEESAAEAERLAESQYNRAILAERRAAEIEAELAKVKQPEKPKEPELVEPNEKDPQWVENGEFNWRKFTKAQADYAAKAAIQAFQKTQAEERSKAEALEHETRIRASADAARKSHPDFDAVMEAAKGSEADIVPQFVLNYIYESDLSAEIAYHLAKNPAESQRIAKMKPILGLAELGKLADKLAAPPAEVPKAVVPPAPPERGGAPPPITPLSGGSGTVNTDPSKMSFPELRRYERERNKRK